MAVTNILRVFQINGGPVNVNPSRSISTGGMKSYNLLSKHQYILPINISLYHQQLEEIQTSKYFIDFYRDVTGIEFIESQRYSSITNYSFHISEYSNRSCDINHLHTHAQLSTQLRKLILQATVLQSSCSKCLKLCELILSTRRGVTDNLMQRCTIQHPNKLVDATCLNRAK